MSPAAHKLQEKPAAQDLLCSAQLLMASPSPQHLSTPCNPPGPVTDQPDWKREPLKWEEGKQGRMPASKSWFSLIQAPAHALLWHKTPTHAHTPSHQ